MVNPGQAPSFFSFERVLALVGKKVVEPPLGLLTVAALLPQDWDVSFVELRATALTDSDWARCDVLFVSGMAVQRAGLLEIIREGRRRGKTVVVGGPYVFHLPDEAIGIGADIVVKGEAEGIVSQLIEAIEQGKSGMVIEAADKPNLNESPLPRYDLLDMSLYLDMPVQFSRGCPFLCEFCDITTMYGRRVRTKDPAQMLRELQMLFDLGWRGPVLVVDDNFIASPLKAKRFVKELLPWQEERGYPFDLMCQASVNLAREPELLDLMARCGFFRVFLGLESLDVDSLKHAKKFQNVGKDLGRVCREINRSGMQIIAGYIMGFDNERPGVDVKVIEFAEANHIPEMFVSLLQAAPGTALWDRLAGEGRLLNRPVADDFGSQTAAMNFSPSRPAEEIEAEFVRIYQVLYDPENLYERTYRHFLEMRPPRFRQRLPLPKPGEIRALLTVLFRHGVINPSRRKFWKYLLLGLWKFPRRLRRFFEYFVIAEHFFEYRDIIRGRFHPNARSKE